jgi:hypothetical protein
MKSRNEEVNRQLISQEKEIKRGLLVKFRENNLTQLIEILAKLDTQHLDFNEHIYYDEAKNAEEFLDGMLKYIGESDEKIKELQKIKFRIGDDRLIELINNHIKIFLDIHNLALNWNLAFFNSKSERENSTTPNPETPKHFMNMMGKMQSFRKQVEGNAKDINKRIEELIIGSDLN